MAVYVQMDMFTMVRGQVYASHHGYPLFPLSNRAFEPSNWVYHDNIEGLSNEESPHGQGGSVGGDCGGVGGSGAGNVGDLDAPSSS